MSKKPLPVYTVKDEGDGFTVYRDATPLQTPRNFSVTAPTRALAEAMREECARQEEKLDLRTMPLTQMTLTALDISAQHRVEVVEGIVKFGNSELICQRASEPPELVAEQNKVWQPYVDWVREKFGVALRTGTGIVPFKQSAEDLARLRAFVDTLDAFRLTGLSEAVGTIGSLILGLALMTGRADVSAIFAAAELDQLWQTRKWGDDPVTEGRHAEIRRDLEMCLQWFNLLKA